MIVAKLLVLSCTVAGLQTHAPFLSNRPCRVAFEPLSFRPAASRALAGSLHIRASQESSFSPPNKVDSQIDDLIFLQCIGRVYELEEIEDKIDGDFKEKLGPFDEGFRSERNFTTLLGEKIRSRCLDEQMDPTKVVFSSDRGSRNAVDGNKKNEKEVCIVRNVMPLECTASTSRIDLALLSACGGFLLGILAVKKEKIINAAGELKALKQLITCMASAQAYWQWGIAGRPGSEPIIALPVLIYPNTIFRVSLWKPKDATSSPCGFMHRLEYTQDPLMMGWVLEQYLVLYKQNFNRFVFSKQDNVYLDPWHWTPLNLDLSKGLPPWAPSVDPNLGFVFSSCAENLKPLLERCEQATTCDVIPPNVPVIVKYFSALLMCPWKDSFYKLCNIIGAAENERMLAEQARIIENERMLAEQARIISESQISGEPVPSTIISSTTSSIVQGTAGVTAIKHPYIGAFNYMTQHGFAVVRDVGVNLVTARNSAEFRKRWLEDSDLRLNFAFEVGASAINLVLKRGLCHNDVRAPNIAVKGDSFCLIDFDLANDDVPDLAITSRAMSGLSSVKGRMLVFTIVQIALVVFALDEDVGWQTVASLTRYWMTDKSVSTSDNKQFKSWLQSRGSAVEPFFSEGGAVTPDDVNTCFDILYSMLS